MFIIGITGGIGCGKSTVAQLCREAGLTVIDADEISRQVTAPGGSAIDPIIAQLGQAVLGKDGGLDRAKMARQVFADRRALDQLSQIVHREVIAEMQRQVEQLRAKKAKTVVLDVPIPVRQGFLDTCDQVWVVWSDEEIRIDRLRGRGLAEDDVRRRMAMQMNREEYEAIADHLIDNNKDYPALVEQVEGLLKQELGNRGIRFQSLLNAQVSPEIVDSSNELSDLLSGGGPTQ
jgi:dephospho-CoA kinase